MSDMNSTENTGQKEGTSAVAVGIGILSAAVLALEWAKRLQDKGFKSV